MTPSRRTRIVATLGPATDRPGVVAALVAAGLDVVRLNCSHGIGEDLAGRIQALRAGADRLGRTVAVLADLPGPKLRVLLTEPRTLSAGEMFVFAERPNSPAELTVTEPECLHDAQPGHRMLLDDGRLQLRVEESAGGRVTARVLIGGVLKPNKGVNLPDTSLSIPSVTGRDRAALKALARAGVDWLALSFVRTASAADELRQAAREVGIKVPVLAKMERPEAVQHAAAIVAAFDGVMVARGDLGVEIPLEKVPLVQKHLIREARAAGKPVITATDMLDSMRTNPRPTRAEAGDVFNAVIDGTDAVMLSGETAIGDYPVEAVACMDMICREAETHLAGRGYETPTIYDGLEDDLAATVCSLAESAEATAIIVPTLSGKTARQIARHRPRAAIIAPVPHAEVRRQLALVWGVHPVPLDVLPAGSDRIDAAVRAAFRFGAVQIGQRVVVMAGHPVEGGEHWPTIRLVRVGEAGTSDEP